MALLAIIAIILLLLLLLLLMMMMMMILNMIACSICTSLNILPHCLYISSKICLTSSFSRIDIVKLCFILSDKFDFHNAIFPSSGCVNSTIWMHHMAADKVHEEKSWQELHKNGTSYVVRPTTSHQ